MYYLICYKLSVQWDRMACILGWRGEFCRIGQLDPCFLSKIHVHALIDSVCLVPGPSCVSIR